MNRICLTNRWNIECFISDSIHPMSWKVKPQKRLFYCELHKHHVLLCSILCVFKYWFYHYIMFWPLLCCSIVKCYCYGVSVTKQIWGDQLNVTLNNWNIGLVWFGLVWHGKGHNAIVKRWYFLIDFCNRNAIAPWELNTFTHNIY